MIAYILTLLASVLFVINDVEGVTMDDALLEAVENPEEFSLNYGGNSNLVKTELDIVFTKDQWNSMSQSRRNKRTAGIKIDNRWGGKRWTNNIVYYEFAYHFTFREKNMIKGAMEEWKKYTCLDFKEASNAPNRIQFKNGDGCSSYLGMLGGPQTISLAKGCRTNRIIIHEIGHALGFHHEQTRPDRDQYVTIKNKNIMAGAHFNFDKQTWNNILYMGVDYDYRSIMHYGRGYFSKNGRDTITTKNPIYQDIIGNVYGLSFADVKTMNIMYNCKKTRGCTKNDNQCRGKGFVGKDCQCWCPADFNDRSDGNFKSAKLCSDTSVGPRPGPKPVTPRPGPKPTGCYDRVPSCSHWAKRGYCQTSQFVRDFCPKSCKRCGDLGKKCKDFYVTCPSLKRNEGCHNDLPFFGKYCKKTCNFCEGIPGCKDRNGQCG